MIPNWNGRRWLPDVPGAVAAQTRPPDEVIVVDNGSRGRLARVSARRAPGRAGAGPGPQHRLRLRRQPRDRGRLGRAGRADQHRRGAVAGLAAADGRGAERPARRGVGGLQDAVARASPPCSTTPATSSVATAPASSEAGSCPTAAPTTSPARCSAPARARRCTDVTRCSAWAASTSAISPIWRMSIWRCGCAWRGGRARISRPSAGTPARARRRSCVAGTCRS